MNRHLFYFLIINMKPSENDPIQWIKSLFKSRYRLVKNYDLPFTVIKGEEGGFTMELKFKEIKAASWKFLQEEIDGGWVDEKMEPYLTQLNNLPFICTLSCCTGHCRVWKFYFQDCTFLHISFVPESHSLIKYIHSPSGDALGVVASEATWTILSPFAEIFQTDFVARSSQK